MPPLSNRRLFTILLLFGLGFVITHHCSQPHRRPDILQRPNDDQAEDAFPMTQPVVSPKSYSTSILHSTQPAGFWVFSQLYLHRGTIYAVTSTTEEKESFPELKFILSQPIKMGPGSSGDKAHPTHKEMAVLTIEEADILFGPLEFALPFRGFSVILYDVSQFMGHYYHWWGELMLGAVKSYSAITASPQYLGAPLEPSRFLIPHVDEQSWRDRAGVNEPLMQAAFQGASVEAKGYWDKLKNTDQTFVFEQAMLVSRIAAHKDPLAGSWGKMIGSTMHTTVPFRFWEPLRQRVIRNMAKSCMGKVAPPSRPRESGKPLVTYISRQDTPHRRLRTEDDEDLIKAMVALDVEGICEFQAVKMEKLTFPDQIQLIAKSTVLIGIHGNGLTHQIWMPSSTQSTVIEIFYPKMYLHDYEILALNVGHKHYAVWNDTFITFPTGETFPGTRIGPELHSSAIPVQGKVVAQIVRQRLAAK
ncbi:hypothetical protein CPB83DRAFT_838167 [Crepidotus variabilis]|uniref:Glycosyltransferase 61 catalytic domain-containing protein n=1 Tax=Crepidotus variabilis TaxID=179855 RepID=A0A9P6E9V3_9AGAR|nr:hypothetical protein CPB83DRAFT_838167 [Crepidotus variabilis]